MPFFATSLSLLDAGALALAADYAAEGRARRVVDFDDHLDDLSRCGSPSWAALHACHPHHSCEPRQLTWRCHAVIG